MCLTFAVARKGKYIKLEICVEVQVRVPAPSASHEQVPASFSLIPSLSAFLSSSYSHWWFFFLALSAALANNKTPAAESTLCSNPLPYLTRVEIGIRVSLFLVWLCTVHSVCEHWFTKHNKRGCFMEKLIKLLSVPWLAQSKLAFSAAGLLLIKRTSYLLTCFSHFSPQIFEFILSLMRGNCIVGLKRKR